MTEGVFACWYVFHGEELVDWKNSISMEFQNFPRGCLVKIWRKKEISDSQEAKYGAIFGVADRNMEKNMEANMERFSVESMGLNLLHFFVIHYFRRDSTTTTMIEYVR